MLYKKPEKDIVKEPPGAISKKTIEVLRTKFPRDELRTGVLR